MTQTRGQGKAKRGVTRSFSPLLPSALTPGTLLWKCPEEVCQVRRVMQGWARECGNSRPDRNERVNIRQAYVGQSAYASPGRSFLVNVWMSRSQ